MAIAPASSAPNPQVINNTLITVPANGNAVNLQASNNNRAPGLGPARIAQTGAGVPAKNSRGSGKRGTLSKVGIAGAGFTTLDSSIRALDAAFEALPDKSPWITYALNINGEWGLCATCQPDFGAKKLYRQYNFNRQILGLASVDAPIDNTEFCDESYDTFDVDIRSPGGSMLCDNSSGTLTGVVVMASCGQSMLNPWVLFPPSLPDATFFDPAPQWQWGVDCCSALHMGGLPSGSERNAMLCYFKLSGAPGTPNLGTFKILF